MYPLNFYQMLKRKDSCHHRSLNGEVISILEEALSLGGINAETILKNAEKLRKKVQKFELTEDTLHQIKNKGRLPEIALSAAEFIQ